MHATSLGGVESLLERRRRWARENPLVPESLLRLSVGIASTFADVDTFIRFASRLLDHTAAEIGAVEVTDPGCSVDRDAA